MIFGLTPKSSTTVANENAATMAYIVTKQNRFYVVTYDGLDPNTGQERRRWHLAGESRADAEAIAANLTRTTREIRAGSRSAATVTSFISDTWMPKRRQHLRPSTAHRYQWMIDNYITPAFGHLPIRKLRAEHLERLYSDLLEAGGEKATGLAPKTVYDVHVIMRAALKYATRIHLVEHNVALDADSPRPVARSKQGPESWTFDQLRQFLAATQHLRLYPALHLAATTGMRRGELAGLRWGDWNRATHSLSIARSRQSVGGNSVEVACKTKSSRRCVDVDPDTEIILATWRRRQHRDGHPVGLNDPIFTNTTGVAVHPESLSQLFTRQLKRIDLPRIRFHDLRHTHATLLAGSNIPIKVVSDQGRVRTTRPRASRLHHGHLSTRDARHGATAACDFGSMLSTQRDQPAGYRRRPPTGSAGRRLPVRVRKSPGHRVATFAAGR